MGLLIGIGETKPTYPYDYYYGIEWDDTVSTGPTRVGKDELHASLPIQSLMKRCILNDDGTVNYYLGDSDSTLKDTGETANLDGTDGQYMVEIPEEYVRNETDGTVHRHLKSQYALPGFHLDKACYVSAVEATVQRSTLALSSVCSEDEDYRGGGNHSAYDGTYRSELGMPATSISLTNFRTYARNRGDTTEWNQYLYQVHRKLFWLFAVEYCTFNSQLAFNAELTSDGYRQGGLGNGVTTVNSTKWSSFNSYRPFIPCGTTNSLGNVTGVVTYTMPFEYDATPDLYAGEWDEDTAYEAGYYVSDGDDLYLCTTDAAAGTAVTDTDYYSSVTRTTENVPSYRGVENPFGHIWKWVDGCLCIIQSDDDGGMSTFYVCDDMDSLASTVGDEYESRGTLPREYSAYVKTICFGQYGEIMPLTLGASSTTYFCDYFYGSTPDSGSATRGVLFGGGANGGAGAGFVCSDTRHSPSYTSTHIGARLCYYPA